MKWITFLLTGIVLAAPVKGAESWVILPTQSTNTIFEVDEDSLERDGSKVKFWERLTFVAPTRTDEESGKSIKQKKVHRLMDCAERRQGFLYGALLDENGALIEATTVDPSEVKMTPVPAGTLSAAELEWACATRTQQ